MYGSHPFKKSQMSNTECEKETFDLSHFIKRFNLIINGRELQLPLSYQSLFSTIPQFANLHCKVGYCLTVVNGCNIYLCYKMRQE